ncbi:MAG TPA: MFS transporter, partial [Thermoanaerobaculia bacterium]|nr:MFS transporter [Thermoanaerobaculia bacterium]
MRRETIRAAAWGLAATVLLAALILVGSRNLAHFDAALVAYTFSVLFATFGLTYRYSMWLQRPPTALFWRRGWQTFLRRGWRLRNAGTWFRRVGFEVLGNSFILRRDRLRGLTHLLIMWGTILAVVITFPLVFGWLYFRPVPGDLSLYEAVVFGFPAFRFPHRSIVAFFLFHGLVWSSFLVIAGVMLAVRRRMREGGAAAVQRFVEDFMPLILLFAVSLTGLMLTASYTWMKG